MRSSVPTTWPSWIIEQDWAGAESSAAQQNRQREEILTAGFHLSKIVFRDQREWRIEGG